MKLFQSNDLTASFYYNGEKVFVTEGVTRLDGGLEVTLEREGACERADKLFLKMKNTGDANTPNIRCVKTLDLTVKTDAPLVYHGPEGDDCMAASFLPKDFTITDTYHEEPFGGRSSSKTGFPFFDLTWGEECAVFGIGWTGQWSKDITVTEDGFCVQLGLAEPDFYLEPGEAVRMASVIILKGEEIGESRRAFRALLREKYSPKTYLGENTALPVAIQCFDRYYGGLEGTPRDLSWNSEEGQRRTVDAAAKMRGIDTLWLDAAWFRYCFPMGVGNYSYSSGFPNGLKPVSDYAHAHGMRFVLWFEPERIFRDTELYDEVDKLLICDPLKSDTRLYNLADDRARAWLQQKLISMIGENGVDVYRQDFNYDPLMYWRAGDGEGRRGVTEMKYIAGLYELWDAILAAYPNILIDNCASGGRRLDFETTQRSVTLWKSDTGCYPDNENRAVTMWSQNQTLVLCEYLPYLACAVWTADPYTVRSTATQGLACNFDIFHPDFDFASAEKALDEVQEFKNYWNGDFYPLTVPAVDESVWAAYQLARESDGAVYVFRRASSEEAEKTFALSAIECEKDYRVTLIDEALVRHEMIVSGKTLSEGFTVTIPQKRESLLVKYEVL